MGEGAVVHDDETERTKDLVKDVIGLVLVVEEVEEQDAEAEPVQVVPEVFEVSGVRSWRVSYKDVG